MAIHMAIHMAEVSQCSGNVRAFWPMCAHVGDAHKHCVDRWLRRASRSLSIVTALGLFRKGCLYLHVHWINVVGLNLPSKKRMVHT